MYGTVSGFFFLETGRTFWKVGHVFHLVHGNEVKQNTKIVEQVPLNTFATLKLFDPFPFNFLYCTYRR